MVQISNQGMDYVQACIDAICKINPHLRQIEHLPAIYDSRHSEQEVPVLSGGGSGHEPAHFGYIGSGMLTAAISGSLFVPPQADDILRVIRFLNRGKGVFIIVKNFQADLEAFGQAIHAARAEGISVKYIVSHDDISVETSNFQLRHRGVAGTILLHKIIGEAARRGFSLDELEALALSLSISIATLGVATKPATALGQDYPMFDLAAGFISYGIGIHGEPGYRTVPFKSSEELANELVNKLKMKLKWQIGTKVIVLVNNLGASSKMEELIFTNDLLQFLELEDLDVSFIKTGHLITSLDMAGLSVTVCPVLDKRWVDYLESPTDAFAW